jgi:hypothetical protein
MEAWLKAGHVFAFFLASCVFVAVPAAHADEVTATLQVNLDWDRKPAEGRKPTDTTVLLGLGYAF